MPRAAQRYAMNANLIFKGLRDPRYAPESSAEPDAACFLPIEIVDRPMHADTRAVADPVGAEGTMEVDLGVVTGCGSAEPPVRRR